MATSEGCWWVPARFGAVDPVPYDATTGLVAVVADDDDGNETTYWLSPEEYRAEYGPVYASKDTATFASEEAHDRHLSYFYK